MKENIIESLQFNCSSPTVFKTALEINAFDQLIKENEMCKYHTNKSLQLILLTSTAGEMSIPTARNSS